MGASGIEAADGAGGSRADRGRRARALAPLAVALLVALFYAPSARLGFVYDDHRLVLDGAPPASAAALAQTVGRLLTGRDPREPQLPYYRPLPRISYAAQRALHGDDPAPFHLANALLMGVAVALCAALLRQPALGIAPAPALLLAALVGLHPAASSTAWAIAGRETLMAASFAVAAVLAFLRGGALGRGLALAFFALALLCKEAAVIVPGLFFAADWLGLSADAPGSARRDWMRRYAPVAAVALAYLLLRVLLLGGAEQHQLIALDRPSGPLLTLLYTAQTLFAPFAALVYEPPLRVWLSPVRQLVAWLAVAALAAAALRRWPGVQRPVIFWLAWIGLALLPVANLLLQETPFAERYALLPLIGAAGACGTIVSAYWSHPSARRAASVGGAVLLLACGAVSVGRAGAFRDDLAFFGRWTRSDPFSATAHFNLGLALSGRGERAAALRSYRRALEIDAEHASAINNTAWHLATAPEPALRDGAAALALALVAVERDAYGDPSTLDTLAAAYAELGRFDEAVVTAAAALALAGGEGSPALVAPIASRLRLYRQGRPYREGEGAGREEAKR